MTNLKSWWKRFGGLFGLGAAAQDFDVELESHLQMHIEDNLRSGMSSEEARRQAILKLGGIEQTRQVYRERATIPSFESLLQDVRFGLRILKRRSGFSIAVIVVLALGIGTNTAIFSIVNAVLLRPLPYEHSERLVVVWQSGNQHRGTGEWFDTYSEYEEWQRNSRSFEQLAALSWAVGGNALNWHGKGHEVLAVPASVGFFSMLSVRAASGRTFASSDLAEGCNVVLSHSFWQNELGAPADIVGQSVPLNQTECRVIGVMPKDFSFYPTQTSLWTLITPNSEFVRDPWRSVTGVFGRLKPGVSRAAAESELATLERNVLPQAPSDLSLPAAVPVVLDLQSEFTWLAGRNLRTALIVLMAAVFVLLLIVCVNVANLLLAHAADRQKEFAVRASLGAGRDRLLRQLLIESTLLSMGGALLGALLGFATVQVFRIKNPIELPPGNPVAVNWQVLAFTALLAMISALLFGIVPARRASRLDLNEALKEAGESFSQTETARRLGFLLVAGEMGLSLTLLLGAGLLIQSLARLASTPLGFRTDHLLTGSIRLPEKEYSDPERKIQFIERLREQVGAIAGTTGVSVASSVYLTGSNVLAVEGKYFSSEQAAHNVANQTIETNYLRVLGIPLLRGRGFNSSDRRSTQAVALVNQALAERYFPNQDPIGHQIKLGAPESPKPWLTIVGIVGNVKTTTVFQEMGYVVDPAVYLPFTQQPLQSMSLLIRTSGQPNAIVNPLEQAVMALDREVALVDVKTMDERLSEIRSQPRFRTILLSAFAGLALVLATIGIYGVLTQSVVRRTREIGVRMALGATQTRVMRMILKQAFTSVLVGLLAGLLASLALVHLIAGLLYEVRPDNPWIFGAVSAVLVSVSMIASYLPARRATAIDPLRALRNE